MGFGSGSFGELVDVVSGDDELALFFEVTGDVLAYGCFEENFFVFWVHKLVL